MPYNNKDKNYAHKFCKTRNSSSRRSNGSRKQAPSLRCHCFSLGTGWKGSQYRQGQTSFQNFRNSCPGSQIKQVVPMTDITNFLQEKLAEMVNAGDSQAVIHFDCSEILPLKLR